MEKDKAVVLETKAVEDSKPVVVEDVAADAKAAVVHEDEVAAIKDSRKRDLLLFKVVNWDIELLRLLSDVASSLFSSDVSLYKRVLVASADLTSACALWIVAVSEHQARMALIDRVYPMEKFSKKDRDCRYVHLLEAKDAAATAE